MPRVRVGSCLLVVLISAGTAAALDLSKYPLLPATSIDPSAFGINSDTVTTISAMSFVPWTAGVSYATSPSLGRYSGVGQGVHYYANLDLPGGAVIDFIGLNSTSDTNAVLGVALWQRDRYANLGLLAGFSVPAHGWNTDLAGPLGIVIAGHQGKEYVLDVEQASSPNFQFWAWVEVWWHRSVSPAPGSPSFNDVPASDPAFQHIEALAASQITAGCGGGNFCPDNPLTRRQMAVFLAKALGLHWPY